MNRETKRRLQRQGQLSPEGGPSFDKKRPAPKAPKPKDQRTKPVAFVREVRNELRKVAWPTRAETTNYATIVFMALVFIILLIFVLDFAFAKSIFFLFDT
jgi:preprotein translocase subunit SecE